MNAARLDANGRIRVTALRDVTTADMRAAGSRHDLPPGERWRYFFALLETMRDLQFHVLQINSFAHGLQTATRVRKAGEPDELVVAALFHDIYDDIVDDHAGAAAALLKDYVSTDVHWLMANHATLQDAHKQYLPSHMRDLHRSLANHPAYEMTRRFCEEYDQCSFDPDYPTLPLEAFRDVAQRVFSRSNAPAELLTDA